MVKRYLTVTSLDATLSLLSTVPSCIPSHEVVPLLKSVGRVTAEPIFALGYRSTSPQQWMVSLLSAKRRRSKQQVTLDHTLR